MQEPNTSVQPSGAMSRERSDTPAPVTSIDRLSPLDRIKRLDEERAALAEAAKDEALARAREAVELLNALGLPYQLLLAHPRRMKKAGKREDGRTDPTRQHCPICNFLTDPPHDGRKHRTQGDDKRPFTDAELRELNLLRA